MRERERQREREGEFCTKEMIQIRSLGEESPLEADPSSHCTKRGNQLAGSIPDPLCKLNLRETSEFVKSLPMTTRSRSENSSSGQRRLEAPSTPGRPVFSFSAGIPSRKSIPSKWDDAEKWLISSSCNESPAHVAIPSNPSRVSRQNGVLRQKGDAFVEKDSGFDGAVDFPDIALHGASAEVFLKDKFTDNVELVFPNFQYSEPTREGFQFRSSYCDHAKDGTVEAVTDVHHRDIGTEMTPLGSSTTSRCHTPIKSASPARHNTPANRSGPLAPSKTSIDMSELQDCHFAKLQLSAQYDSMVSNWSSREEEEKEGSKSLRHSDSGGGRKSIAEARASVWEEEERTKSCIRYQREEAKIQAWVNLQSAKAEAQSRKLEVKIQKMRSDLEDKLMKRMAVVQRRAEDWRATGQLQHSQQVLRASEQARKMRSQEGPQFYDHASCGCFPCRNLL